MRQLIRYAALLLISAGTITVEAQQTQVVRKNLLTTMINQEIIKMLEK